MKWKPVVAGVAAAPGACGMFNHAFRLGLKPQYGAKVITLNVQSQPQGITAPRNLRPLDRIDQRGNVTDRQYFYERTGMGVHAYVVDTGIYSAHNDFSGRVTPIFDFAVSSSSPDFGEGTDGHGTRSASQIGSKNFGVAKNVMLYSARFGTSSAGTPENLAAAIRACKTHATGGLVKRLPAVINISAGLYCEDSNRGANNGTGQRPSGVATITNAQRDNVEDAVMECISAGMTVVCGTDNDGIATRFFTPARRGAGTAGLITVGFTRGIDSGDVNGAGIIDDSAEPHTGSPVEMWAPAGDVNTGWVSPAVQRDTTYGLADGGSGCSMASPLVAGACALYMEQFAGVSPFVNPSPASVENAVRNAATNTCAGTNLLYTGCDFLPAYGSNPINDSRKFVMQQYLDFLGRAPDDSGLDFWVNEVDRDGRYTPFGTGCFGRVNTSKAFFLSIENFETGYYVYRLNRLSFDSFLKTDGSGFTTRTNPRMEQLFTDQRKVGRNVVVGQAGWENQLAANQLALANEWVNRPAFVAKYPGGMDNNTFVTTLYQNAQLPLDDVPTFVQQLNSGVPRGQVMHNMIKSDRLSATTFADPYKDTILNLYNPAYVLMNYFGYVRRNPDDVNPNTGTDYNDLGGYNFWLTKTNDLTVQGNPAALSEMIRAFLESDEYNSRFRRVQAGTSCGQPADPGCGGGGIPPGDGGGGDGGGGLPYGDIPPNPTTWPPSPGMD